MNNQAVGKINKIGKAGSIIVLILKIFLIIGFIGCFIAAVALAVLPKDFVTVSLNGDARINVDLSEFHVALSDDTIEKAIEDAIVADMDNNSYVSLGNASIAFHEVKVTDSDINISGTGQFMNFSISNCVYAILVAMITLAMSFVTMMFAGFLTKAFAKCNSPFDEEVIRKMKHFAYSLIPWTVISGIGNAIASNIFTGGKANYNISVNVTYVFIVLIILGLSYIFQYGAELQRESDETL